MKKKYKEKGVVLRPQGNANCPKCGKEVRMFSGWEEVEDKR